MRCILSQLSALTFFLAAFASAQISFNPQTQQATPPPSNTPPEQRCIVAGRVTNAQTGEPLKKVLLRLDVSTGKLTASRTNAPEGYAISSDTEGNFHFDGVEPGSYTLSAHKTGFLDYNYGAATLRSPARILTLAPAQQLTALDIALQRQGVISGKVFDEDGDPAPSVNIQLLRSWWTHGKLQYLPASSSATNDLGEYRISNLTPGKYYLFAEPQDFASLQQSAIAPGKPDIRPVRTYYPDALTLAGATPIEIKAGQDAPGVDIRLHAAATYHVRGKIAGSLPEGDLDRLIVTITTQNDEVFWAFGGQSAIQKDLSFDVAGVAPGAHIVNVSRMGGGSLRFLAHQPIDVGSSDLTGLIVNLVPLLSLRGQIRIEGTPAGPPVSLSTLRMSLTPADRTSMFASLNQIAFKPDGAFTLENIFPGKYFLRLVGTRDGTYLKSVRLGQEEMLGKALDLSASGELDILVRYGPAEVDGTVAKPDNTASASDSQSSPQTLASPATVILVPESPDADGAAPGQSTARADGSFSVKQVPPGRYRAYAFEQVESELLQNPDVLAQLQPMAVEIDLKENEKKQIQLPLISAAQFQQLLDRLGIDPQ
ncbi:MAG: carboxypeptidase regulatory-like domain-containing protein [Acidobacteriaceae bacterium]|nr:carboxypeptidase regulatory-like domain-containing protein [Acidobacteriaceae bacterium]